MKLVMKLTLSPYPTDRDELAPVACSWAELDIPEHVADPDEVTERYLVPAALNAYLHLLKAMTPDG